ncbi:UDP-glucose 4-epimerase GalE [Aureibaculum luteum]|uniref:UDP-glucose 4-epimerase GalE n=1 Tax=Aureibaculum luteum TaxID=1548456 RepID=UPI000E527246|nr:UDP-glucose 4-epimerase GalE [Aureibaculum luteum]
MKQKIIITGGTGYIGSHTAVEFITKGFNVVIVDNLSNSDISVLDRIKEITGTKPEFEQIDLTDNEKTKSFFERHKDVSGVINFAALKAVGESVQKPILYYQNNINILLNVLENMETYGISNLIFSSSATVYGLPETLPITENAQTKRPTSPYGNTKKVAEEIIEDLSKVSESLNAISLRYFNPIGAHNSLKIGEAPSGIPNNLMPFITQTAAGLRDELKVFGNDYDTPDGTAVRDYLHVVDLAKAHVLAYDRLLHKRSKSNFEVYNLGTGIGYSVLDVIQSFEKTTGLKLNYSFDQRREGDVPQLYSNPLKANKELQWKATLSLDDMTLSSWEWEQNLRKNK